MRYRLICNNDKGSFTIREEEVKKLIEARSKNSPAIFKEGAVLNWNMYSGLVVDKERLDILADYKRLGVEQKEPSPFENLLSSKLMIE